MAKSGMDGIVPYHGFLSQTRPDPRFLTKVSLGQNMIIVRKNIIYESYNILIKVLIFLSLNLRINPFPEIDRQSNERHWNLDFDSTSHLDNSFPPFWEMTRQAGG